MIKAKISQNASIVYEEQCYFHETSEVLGYCRVGAYSYFGQYCIVGEVQIGRFCSVAPGVKIGLGEHDVNYVSTHPFFFGSQHNFQIPNGVGVPRDLSLKKYSPPIIGNDVWIGANAVICRGVNICDGAVIAAGAIVTQDVEPYSIVGGVPAKHIRFRFSENIIKRLLDIKWWNFDLNNFVGLDSSNVEAFLDELESKKLNEAKYARVVFF